MDVNTVEEMHKWTFCSNNIFFLTQYRPVYLIYLLLVRNKINICIFFKNIIQMYIFTSLASITLGVLFAFNKRESGICRFTGLITCYATVIVRCHWYWVFIREGIDNYDIWELRGTPAKKGHQNKLFKFCEELKLYTWQNTKKSFIHSNFDGNFYSNCFREKCIITLWFWELVFNLLLRNHFLATLPFMKLLFRLPSMIPFWFLENSNFSRQLFSNQVFPWKPAFST